MNIENGINLIKEVGVIGTIVILILYATYNLIHPFIKKTMDSMDKTTAANEELVKTNSLLVNSINDDIKELKSDLKNKKEVKI